MTFQTCKTFVHLQNTNEDLSDELRAFCPSIDSLSNYRFDASKRYEIVKLIHMSIFLSIWKLI